MASADNRAWQYVGAAAAIVLAAAVGYLMLGRAEHEPAGLLRINGRIEGDRVLVASKLAGRIVELQAREGDRVRAGQVLARLDDRALQAKLAQARAAEDTLNAQIAAQQAALAVLRGEAAVAVAAAQAGVAAADAEARRVDAALAQAERELQRARELSSQGFVGPQALERAALEERHVREQRDVVRAESGKARQALRSAELGPQRIAARQAELDATRARAREAAAVIAEVQAALDDMRIEAPGDGTVTTRYADAGEVIGAGSPVLELVDLGRLYLKGYIPEPMIGKVRRGLPARIRVDAYPGQPFAATVRYVAARAEFTPKEVQTVDERVKLVYEVRLYADGNPDGKLNPGQPADGEIRWQEGAPWTSPH